MAKAGWNRANEQMATPKKVRKKYITAFVLHKRREQVMLLGDLEKLKVILGRFSMVTRNRCVLVFES